MATKPEVLKILRTLKAKYPYFKIDKPDEMIEAYTQELIFFSAETLEMAADIIVSESKFFPAVHDIRKIADALEKPRKTFDLRFTEKMIEIKNSFLQTGEIDYQGLSWIEKWAGNAGYEHTVMNVSVQRNRMERAGLLPAGG